MRKVVCSMGTSLDGYVVDGHGSFQWATPDPEVFRAALDELRAVDVHLLGRRLYETMLYWDTADQDPTLSADEREWTEMWKALPRVVFSRTLTSAEGGARLAGGGLAEEVARWRAEPGEGDIAVGGATLVESAAAADLVDEYRLRVHPVLVGGGTPFFPRSGRRVDLELVGSRTFACGVVQLRYRVQR